jgi:hypothetical protein
MSPVVGKSRASADQERESSNDSVFTQIELRGDLKGIFRRTEEFSAWKDAQLIFLG